MQIAKDPKTLTSIAEVVDITPQQKRFYTTRLNSLLFVGEYLLLVYVFPIKIVRILRKRQNGP